MSRYLLNKLMRDCLSIEEHPEPMLMNLMLASVPRLTSSCESVELCVLVFGGPNKRFYRSNKFSSVTTPLGMGFPLCTSASSYKDLSCSSSSIPESLNTYAFSMKSNICCSSLKMHKLVTLSRRTSL